jgi:hypothetical protein
VSASEQQHDGRARCNEGAGEHRVVPGKANAAIDSRARAMRKRVRRK